MNSDGGRGVTHEEMRIFNIAIEDIPRLMAAWDAWFEFLGLVISGNSHSDRLLADARQQHPELTGGNEPELLDGIREDIRRRVQASGGSHVLEGLVLDGA